MEVRILLLLIFASLNFFSAPIFAQPNETRALEQLLQQARQENAPPELTPPENGVGFGYPDLTAQAAILVFLALLPFFVMLLTSFLKMVITLALLRSALGVQQTPPNQVINGIALILSLYVMYPTGLEMYNRGRHIIERDLPTELFSANSAAVAIAVIDEAREPLRQFLLRNTNKKNLDGFYKIAQKTFPEEAARTVTTSDFIIVVPSFITTQIRAAFEIGVLIYLPFFVIDLVTSNILLAMQMMMLSPLSISLPLKLLLVVMIDGWTILVQGLVLSFN
ncbi:MAG: type III secretion system export apparatus subunit SctR [Chlamydiales bacterium]|nr:type III secretion system export apparatus subunit SctR [Chlamydiales bacterium]